MRTVSGGRIVVFGSCLALGLCVGLAGCSGSQPPPEGPPTASSSPGSTARLPDFDGDGAADLVAGIGEAEGRVTIRYASGRTQDVRRADLDGATSATFARAILARDLDRDGFTDLVVSDPGSEVAAAVFLLPGSANGLDVAGAHALAAPGGLAGFGAALAVVEEPETLLMVGAPGEGRVTAPGGAVVTWHLDEAGAPDGDPEVATQDSTGRPGGGSPGDGFGGTLAGSGSWLAIGAPRKDASGVRDVGEVLLVDYSTPNRRSWTLGPGDGVPAAVAAETRFGFSMSAADGHLAVGVPMDDTHGQDAGLVQPFRLGPDGPMALDAIRPSDLGIDPADGILFGFSVAMAHACAGTPGVLVGAPATASGEVSAAGAAWLVPLAEGQCAPRALAEGGALGGAPTEMASLGVAVSAQSARDEAADTLVLTAPGNSEEGVAGRVLLLDPPYAGPARVALEGLRLREEGAIVLSPSAG